jgi:hypothetical protein
MPEDGYKLAAGSVDSAYGEYLERLHSHEIAAIRNDIREQRRFEAALAIYCASIVSPIVPTKSLDQSAIEADALIAALDKPIP